VVTKINDIPGRLFLATRMDKLISYFAQQAFSRRWDILLLLSINITLFEFHFYFICVITFLLYKPYSIMINKVQQKHFF